MFHGPSARRATLPPAVARACARRACRRRPGRDPLRQPPGDAGNHSRLRLDRRDCGPDQYRRDGPADRVLSVEQRRVPVCDRGAVRRTPGARHRRHGVAAFDLGDRIRCATEQRTVDGGHAATHRDGRRRAHRTRRHARDHLYQRHHRPLQRRDVPTRAILLVGRSLRPTSGRERGRRALHHTAAFPYQCAQHFRTGAAQRRARWRSNRASRPPPSGRP